MHFNDSNLNTNIKEFGFSTIPLLSADEIGEAMQILKQFGLLKSGEGFQNIVNIENANDRKEVNQSIINFLFPKVKHMFSGYVPFIGSFAIKHKSNINNVPLHLDWSVLDETKFTSYNVWIPLEQVRTENGCMGVLEKSHTFEYNIRGSLINNIATLHSDSPIISTLKDTYAARPQEMEAGSALIYNHRMAHYSYPNTTSKPRIAISMVMVPKNAPLLQYHFENDESISVYELNTDFYLNYDMQTHPKEFLKKIETIPSNKIGTIENQLDPLIYIDK